MQIDWRVVFSILAIIIIAAGMMYGFFYLSQYVNRIKMNKPADSLEILDMPDWVGTNLQEKLYNTAFSSASDLKINENTAKNVQRNIESRFHWLSNVKVKVGNDTIRVFGKWRKPLGFVKAGSAKYYIDKNLTVLDYIPLPELAIVEIRGIGGYNIPPAGGSWARDDLAAAVEIISRLDKMDSKITPDKPLLSEIESIDVSNFTGRENKDFAHIIMYAKDNTEIIWGAEFGSWQRNLETSDREKIQRLYEHYKRHGTLLGKTKYIDLRTLDSNFYMPVDKY